MSDDGGGGCDSGGGGCDSSFGGGDSGCGGGNDSHGGSGGNDSHCGGDDTHHSSGGIPHFPSLPDLSSIPNHDIFFEEPRILHENVVGGSGTNNYRTYTSNPGTYYGGKNNNRYSSGQTSGHSCVGSLVGAFCALIIVALVFILMQD